MNRQSIHFRQKSRKYECGALSLVPRAMERDGRRFLKERLVFARKPSELPEATPRGDLRHRCHATGAVTPTARDAFGATAKIAWGDASQPSMPFSTPSFEPGIGIDNEHALGGRVPLRGVPHHPWVEGLRREHGEDDDAAKRDRADPGLDRDHRAEDD